MIEHASSPEEDQQTQNNKTHESALKKTLSDLRTGKKFEVVIESGTLTRNTEWLGKMSPYVQIQYNGWI